MLPAGLTRLELYGWTLPPSHLALPESLLELHIHDLPDRPLPALPPQLQTFAIDGGFNQPLTGLLPASLTFLSLLGRFDQPLTADVFASTPRLEQLYLSQHSAAGDLAESELPRSLRVLRVGRQYSLLK